MCHHLVTRLWSYGGVFITFFRCVSATGRSYEDILKIMSTRNCTIFASLLTLSHTFKQHGLPHLTGQAMICVFFYQKFLVIIKSSVKVRVIYSYN